MQRLLIAAGALVLAAIVLFVVGLRQASDALLWWAVACALLAVAALTARRFRSQGATNR